MNVPEGWRLVPEKMTDEMMDAWCDAEPEGYWQAVQENRRRHAALKAKYPDIKPHVDGAAPIQYLPDIWAAVLAAAPKV